MTSTDFSGIQKKTRKTYFSPQASESTTLKHIRHIFCTHFFTDLCFSECLPLNILLEYLLKVNVKKIETHLKLIKDLNR